MSSDDHHDDKVGSSSAASSSLDRDSDDHKELSSSPNLELRALIDNTHVGGIIGKGGANVKRVREDSGAFVSILKSDFRNVQERIMLLKGTPTQIGKAALLLAELLVESAVAKKEAGDSSSSSSSNTETASIKLLVHKSQIGAIIGKAGAVIKETQSETGARVQVSNEPLPQSTDKTVNVSGNPQAVHDAIFRIASQLKDSPLRAGTKSFPYTPGVYPSYGSHGSHGPSYHPPPAGAGAASGPTSTQKIAIPTVCCGCVIGRNGKTNNRHTQNHSAIISQLQPERK